MAATMTREDLKSKLDRGERFKLVNVLSPASFEHGHIPRSINVPLQELEERAPSLWSRDEEIVVYCGSFECTASPTAARTLEKLGFTKVVDYEGGMADWRDAGYPVHESKDAWGT